MDIITTIVFGITMLAFGMVIILLIVIMAHAMLYILQLMKHRLMGKKPLVKKGFWNFIFKRKVKK